MYLRNYFKQFVRDLLSQKLRTFLTVFGIVWGTASVTLLLAFGEGFHKQVGINMKGLGENIVIAWPTRTSLDWRGLPHGRRIRVTDEDMELIRRQVPEVARISGEMSETGTRVRAGRSTVAPQVVGANVEFAEMRSMIAEQGGRYLNPIDLGNRRRVVFLGDQLKQNLFGIDEAVGRYIYFDGVPFLVVGVMREKTQDSNYSGRDEDKATIPLPTFQAVYGQEYLNNFVFQVADPADVEAAKEGVVATLARKYRFDPEDKEAILMWDTTEMLVFLDAFFLGFRLFLGIVGALTLVVGGIGVSNIMNVVVEERTKEIGIKMALGAKRRYVLGQFLFETLLLTAVGGAIGLGIAWSICAVFPSFGLKDYVGDPVISAQVAILTTSILGAIGFLAGFFPARTAANLKPVEALRM
ncbi:MAG: ABC transporter permease [Thermoanaerobaculia bacterium]|nr:ABC transporter permease [Thermoanaerobaculia bacterium]